MLDIGYTEVAKMGFLNIEFEKFDIKIDRVYVWFVLDEEFEKETYEREKMINELVIYSLADHKIVYRDKF